MSERSSARGGQHRRGRPSLYRPAICTTVVECGREGWSLSATAAKIGVHRETLLNWGAAHPEFFDALKIHGAARAEWWEGQLRKIAQDGGAPGQATACIFALKNGVPSEWRSQDRHIKVTLPPLESPADLPAVTQALLQSVASGELTPTEGEQIARLLEAHRRAVETADLERRLAALEAQQEGKR
jgi:hypothetical protein